MVSIQESTAYSIKCGLASFLATYIAGVMHPLDLIKTRFQSHDGKASIDNQVPQYQGLIRGLKQIYINEGFRGLYKGFYISVLSQAIATSLFFLLYEKRKKFYQQKGYSTMNAVTYSSIQASIIGTIATQPIWVVKTRMLLNINPKIGQIQNAISKSRQIYYQSGWKGFLKGLQLSVILSFSGVLQMYVYQGSKILYNKFSIPQSILNQKSFICGSLSKIVAVLITYPLTTVRTRIQQNQYFNNRSQAKYQSVSDITVRLIRDEGIRGFYKGIVPNLFKGIPQRGIYFYCYELFKKLICQNSLKNK